MTHFLEKKGPHPQLAPWGFPRAVAQASGRYQLDWPWTQASPCCLLSWMTTRLREGSSLGTQDPVRGLDPGPLVPPPSPTRVLQNRRVFLATFAAVLGNFSFGYALVYTSPVIPALKLSSDPELHLDKKQASWFGVRPVL